MPERPHTWLMAVSSAAKLPDSVCDKRIAFRDHLATEHKWSFYWQHPEYQGKGFRVWMGRVLGVCGRLDTPVTIRGLCVLWGDNWMFAEAEAGFGNCRR